MGQEQLFRAQLPAAYMDPAFMACVNKAVNMPELVQQFDRLYGADLTKHRSGIEQMIDQATGKSDSDIASFMSFVHDSVYMRVPDQVIFDLRESAAKAGITPEDMGDI
jgi:hypothetical protein